MTQSDEDYEWECLQERIERNKAWDEKRMDTIGSNGNTGEHYAKLTPCQKLGYKVGDEFVVKSDNGRSPYEGKRVIMTHEGSEFPYFVTKDHGRPVCLGLDQVVKTKDADEQDDPVNQPSHYNQGGIECIEAIKASMSHIEYLGYLKGNCQKYIWRYRNKGNMRQDLAKAKWYLEELEKEVGGTE